MFGRLIGLLITMGIIGYMMYAVLKSDNDVQKSIDNSPTTISNKAALKSAGIDADNKKELEKAMRQQADEIIRQRQELDEIMKNQ